MSESKARSKMAETPLIPTGQGCLLWSGRVAGTGYGRVRAGGRDYAVHRLVYAVAYGAIPEGLHVHHRCGVRLCCNPEHLCLLSPEAHGALSREEERHQEAYRQKPGAASATHCPNGHEYTEANTGAQGGGMRRCRTCTREKARRNKARQRLARAALGLIPRPQAVLNAAKTHCPQGHPYDRQNTLLRKGGRERACRACAARQAKERRIRKQQGF